MYAFIGILISSGVNNSNTDHTSEMWKSTSYPLYRATIGQIRFVLYCDLCVLMIRTRAKQEQNKIKLLLFEMYGQCSIIYTGNVGNIREENQGEEREL